MLDEFFEKIKLQYPPDTASGYIYDINTFRQFLKTRYALASEDADIDVTENILIKADTADIIAFLNEDISAKSKSAATANRKLSSIKKLYAFLQKNRFISTDPAAALKTMRTEKSRKKIFTVEECVSLLNSIGGRNRLRDFTMIYMFLCCALHVDEIIQMRKSDIDSENIYIRKNSRLIKIIKKNEALKSILSGFLFSERVDTNINGNADEYLFTAKGTEPISKRTVHQICVKWLKKANLYEEGMTSETMRKTGAYLMLQNGAAQSEVADYLHRIEPNFMNDIRSLSEVGDKTAAVQIISRELLDKNPLSKYRLSKVTPLEK